MLKIKRAYEPFEPGDGYLILVDRLWPRGLSKERARIDCWLKEVAPSDSLRKWFGHEPAKWNVFRRRYCRELWEHPCEILSILEQLSKGDVTLVYGAKDQKHNQAVALQEFVLETLKELKSRKRPKCPTAKRRAMELHTH